MSFALRRQGAWWIGYTDQTGRAVLQQTSCVSRAHAEDSAERLEAMAKRLRLGLSLERGEALRAEAEGAR